MGGVPTQIEGYTLHERAPGYVVFDLPSTTWSATRHSDRRRVVITVVNSGAAESVQRELDALIFQLGPDYAVDSGTGLPSIVDHGTTGGCRWLATVALEGGTLAERFPLASAEMAKLGDQLGQAVGRLHARGRTHGSISPHSIRFDDYDQPVLCLAPSSDADAHRPPMDGHHNSAEQMDLYALASVLHEGVAGPWSEGERVELTTVGVIPEVAVPLHAALSPDPLDRPADPEIFSGLLAYGATLLGAGEIPLGSARVLPVTQEEAPRPEFPLPAASLETESRRWKASLVMGALVIIGVIGAILVTRTNDPTRVESAAIERATTTLFGTAEPFEPVAFDPEPLTNGAVLLRTWTVSDDGSSFTSLSVLSNSTSVLIETFHVESIPKELASDVSMITFDPAPSEVIQADPVVKWLANIGPGQRVAVQSRLPLLKRPSMADLESWKAATTAVEARIRFDQQQTFCATVTCTQLVPEPPSEMAPAAPAAPTAPTQPGVATDLGEVASGPDSTISGSPSATPSTAPKPRAPAPKPGSPIFPVPTAAPSTAPPGPGATAPPTTAAPTVPDAPRNVVVGDPQGFGDCESSPSIVVKLSWAAPTSNGGKRVTGYVLSATRAASGSESAWSSDIGALEMAREALINIPASVSEAPVVFEIRARNAVGASIGTMARVVVPSVVGQCAGTATRALRSVGLNVNVDRSTCPNDQSLVSVQAPLPGTTVVAGSSIRLS